MSKRFTVYFSKKALKNKTNTGASLIYSALLKHGYDKFSL